MARAARDRGYPVQLVAGDNLATEDFALIAGPAAEGTLFTDDATRADTPKRRQSSSGSERGIRARGLHPVRYGAVQAWAQAVEKAGSLELQAMIAVAAGDQFDTVLGRIDFDDKGDVTVQNPIWYVWRGRRVHAAGAATAGAAVPLGRVGARSIYHVLEGSVVIRRRLLVVSVVLIASARRARRAEILIGVAGPMTGKDAWFGEQMQRGAALAVADINAAGGVLGEQVELITVDDFCDPEQAVAAARKLVSDGVIFVVGHYCSGASIPASEVYEAAGVLQISPASTNPMLTELGRANVFRVVDRDDAVRCRGRQLPGRSLGRQKDRDPA